MKGSTGIRTRVDGAISKIIPKSTVKRYEDLMVRARMNAGAMTYLISAYEYAFSGAILVVFVALIAYLFYHPLWIIVSSASFLVYALAIYYIFTLPEMKVKAIRSSVEHVMPDALAVAYGLSLSGVPADTMISELSGIKELGEFAKESQRVNSFMYAMGYDFLSALERSEKVSASPDFSRFVAGIRLSIILNSDLTAFLRDRLDYYRRIQENRSKLSLDSLGLAAESYVAVVIAFPILLYLTGSIISIKNSSVLFFALSMVILFSAAAVMGYFTDRIRRDV
ncbi:type II secretion system F family protein [Thermoplasma sp.]|uniref:type II secretion system F family protein n=1 Tax=Thermoplasma sp. TaxID=1973142 RepID=UPI0025F98CF4|nr:type II secretion system F family protein [Thermoplasma sp.]